MADKVTNSEAKSFDAVVLGVTSSIAAYKAADITSSLVQKNIDVNVIMTEDATKLVRPQTFTTLSRNQTITDLWNVPDWRPEHIALADKTDLLLVAPATANFIGKMANGIADDALSTYALSHNGPVLIAPAMNPKMWRHPAVQENCRKLRDRGVRILEPEGGHVACGSDTDKGRLRNTQSIVNATLAHLAVKDLQQVQPGSKKLLVTAGPTREPIDSVRFISNYSSGKMGYAIAETGRAMGFDTTLVSGPVTIPPPEGVKTIQTDTAEEMNNAVTAEFPSCDILVMAAAVGDFRVARTSSEKIKKHQLQDMQLQLEFTEDILQNLSAVKKENQKVVGFAAESTDIIENAQKKLMEKSLDFIIANDISKADIGFGAEDNKVTLITPTDTQDIERMSKLDLSAKILQYIT